MQLLCVSNCVLLENRYGSVYMLVHKFWHDIVSVDILQITIEAMKSEHDEIALQGIEFWSTVCDEEVDLGIELHEVAWLWPTFYFVAFIYLYIAVP